MTTARVPLLTVATIAGAAASVALMLGATQVLAQPPAPDVQAMLAACQSFMAQFGSAASDMMGSMGSGMGSMTGSMSAMMGNMGGMGAR